MYKIFDDSVMRYKDIKELMSILKLVYTAVTEAEALNNLIRFKEKWNKVYLSCVKTWEDNWGYREDEKDYALNRYNPIKMFDVLDTFGDFKKPIHLSEITISAYSNSEEDEAIQAELAKNMYKIWFSHKDVEAIIYWNLIDGYTSGSSANDMTAGENKYCGALLNFDFSPKPIFKEIDNLINHEWHTEEIFGTNEYGFANISGFKGDYVLEINYNGKNYIKNTKINDRYDVIEHITLD